MPKISLVITNEFRDDYVVFYDDGLIAFADEKCWLVLGGDGHVVERFWKEEPQSVYHKAFCDYDGPVIDVPEWPDSENTVSPFASLVFAVTRKASDRRLWPD